MPDLRDLLARAVGPVPHLDPDALRRRITRRRRRRAVAAAMVAAGVVAAVVAVALGSRTTGGRVVVGPGTSHPAASTPTPIGRRGALGYPVVATHPEAFRGFGRLVYYSGSALEVLDGRGPQRSIPIPAAPEKVRWSADGSWLAVETQQTGLNASELLVVRADSTRLTRVPVSSATNDWAWSPHRDVLAVVEPGPTARGAIALYAPDRPGVALATPFPAAGAAFVAWSPDGTRLVYDTYTPRPPFVDDLWSVDVSGCPARCGTPERVPIRVPRVRNEDVGLVFAGWSADGTRLLVWLDVAHSGSVLMDGLRVESVPFAVGARGTRASDAVLPVMLAKPSWIAPVPGGSRAVVDAGGGRVWDQPRRLDACDLASGRCSPLVSGSGPVVDPAVSPDGSRLAYVATDHVVFANNEELPPKSSERWTRSRRLVVAGTRPPVEERRVIATGGVVAPRWMSDSRHLVFWRAGYLWLVDADHPEPVAIAGQLAARADDSFGFGPFEDSPYILPGNDVWDSADWHG